jgi:Na+/glutamate symporter
MSINKNVIRQITIAMFFFTVLGSFFKLIFIFLIHPQVVLADYDFEVVLLFVEEPPKSQVQIHNL